MRLISSEQIKKRLHML